MSASWVVVALKTQYILSLRLGLLLNLVESSGAWSLERWQWLGLIEHSLDELLSNSRLVSRLIEACASRSLAGGRLKTPSSLVSGLVSLARSDCLSRG